MNATCRHEFASSLLVLSYDSPVNSSPSSGMTFHSLHATSHALQPMQIVVSVKKPCRGFGSAYVAWPSALTVGLHELRQRRPARTSPRPDVARRRLHLLDVDVRVEDDRVDVVRRVALRQAAVAPVVRQPDLVDLASLHLERRDALGHHDAGLDRSARGDDRRPTAVLEPALLRELG